MQAYRWRVEFWRLYKLLRKQNPVDQVLPSYITIVHVIASPYHCNWNQKIQILPCYITLVYVIAIPFHPPYHCKWNQKIQVLLT